MDMIWEQALLSKPDKSAGFVEELSHKLAAVLQAEAARLIEGALEDEAERSLGRKPYQ